MKKCFDKYPKFLMLGLVSFLSLMFVGISCSPNENLESWDRVVGQEKAFVSFRIGSAQSLSATRFNALLDMFDKYPGLSDEITLFTSTTHAPIPLEEFQSRMLVFKERMEAARERGYKSGLNILTTIGHHEENLDHSIQGEFQNVMDIEGNISKGSYCPNDTLFQNYIREVYKAMTQANPDYIWLDDDIRLAGHKPISLTCFCDHCLNLFEEETGEKYSRQSFQKAVNEGDIEKKISLRKKWLQHNRNTLNNLFRLIEKTVHEIKPDMPLGFMTGDRFYEGYDFDSWTSTLSGSSNSPVLWRPGGGFYHDDYIWGLVDKSHAIGRQVSLLPDHVVSIQSEIENFPYQSLKKAANIVVLEASSHIAAGCTGAAFNVLSLYDEPLDEYESLLSKIHESRPFFDLMCRILGRTPISGIHTFWNKDSFSTRNLKEGNWFSTGQPVTGHEIYNIGLPASYSKESSPVILIGKDDILGLSPKEINSILSNGVYMDAETLQQLNNKGFGHLTGFDVVNSVSADRIEKFTNHPLNVEYGGRVRDNRQSFWTSTAHTLRKTEKNATFLSGLIDYMDNDAGAGTMGVFENSLGGRICVSGYFPWTFQESLSKTSQMKSVFRWLSNDKLPGYVASYHKINVWIREPRDGRIALAFTNSSYDPAVDIELKLRCNTKIIQSFDMQGNQTTIRSSGSDGPYETFVIPYVEPWQMRLIHTN